MNPILNPGTSTPMTYEPETKPGVNGKWNESGKVFMIPFVSLLVTSCVVLNTTISVTFRLIILCKIDLILRNSSWCDNFLSEAVINLVVQKHFQ